MRQGRPMRMCFAALLVGLAVVPGPPVAPSPAGGRAQVVRSARALPAGRPGSVDWSPPLAGSLRVTRVFEAPASSYSAGHRGVDLAAGPGVIVRAAGAGRVTFAGSVAGRGVVVITHADGISTEYEPIEPVVKMAAAVEGGQLIGYVYGRHDRCALDSCLHWGARRGGKYFDPMALLAPLGPVRLVPWTTDG